MHIAKLFFGLRMYQSVHMEEATFLYDKCLSRSIKDIVVCGVPFFGNIQWRLASLLIRFGGLGSYSIVEASCCTFVATRSQMWVLQDHILPDSDICGMDSDYVCALAWLLDMICGFDFNDFINKVSPLLKPNMHWWIPLLVKLPKIWKYTTKWLRHKFVF